MPDEQERARRVQLSLISEPGDSITAVLIARHGTEHTIRVAQEDHPELPEGITLDGLVQWQERLRARLDTHRAAAVLERCEQDGVRILIPGDDHWPTGLDDLPAPPHLLYVRGDTSHLARPLTDFVALTGTRAETGYGAHITTETAIGLADTGKLLVTGGAYGIEAAVHRAALAGDQPSIAVMAGGLDRLYPNGNRELLERVEARGALVSEHPFGAPPTRWRFLQRSRILAALSAATVITEAGTRSGALHTARVANDLGRIVAAFPGPVTSPSSAGPHLLVSAGLARLVTGPTDIHALLHPSPDAVPGIPAERTEAERAAPDRRASLPPAEPRSADAPARTQKTPTL